MIENDKKDLEEGLKLGISSMEYSAVRQLEDGTLIGIRRFLFTIGLCVGIDSIGNYDGRYCYPFEHLADAIKAYETYEGESNPYGKWIKYKGKGGERERKCLIDKNAGNGE